MLSLYTIAMQKLPHFIYRLWPDITNPDDHGFSSFLLLFQMSFGLLEKVSLRRFGTVSWQVKADKKIFISMILFYCDDYTKLKWESSFKFLVSTIMPHIRDQRAKFWQGHLCTCLMIIRI